MINLVVAYFGGFFATMGFEWCEFWVTPSKSHFIKALIKPFGWPVFWIRGLYRKRSWIKLKREESTDEYWKSAKEHWESNAKNRRVGRKSRS